MSDRYGHDEDIAAFLRWLDTARGFFRGSWSPPAPPPEEPCVPRCPICTEPPVPPEQWDAPWPAFRWTPELEEVS